MKTVLFIEIRTNEDDVLRISMNSYRRLVALGFLDYEICDMLIADRA